MLAIPALVGVVGFEDFFAPSVVNGEIKVGKVHGMKYFEAVVPAIAVGRKGVGDYDSLFVGCKVGVNGIDVDTTVGIGGLYDKLGGGVDGGEEVAAVAVDAAWGPTIGEASGA